MAAMRWACLAAISCMCACSPPPAYEPIAAGDAQRGAAAVAAYECGACHVIPGIPGAWGRVGPPLDRFAHHAYIAGRFPNTPEQLVQWLQNPPAMAPRTAMPNVGISSDEARDMAAFLYTLE